MAIRQKQPSRGVLGKRCSENMQQIYRLTSMPKCDFNKISKHNSGTPKRTASDQNNC